MVAMRTTAAPCAAPTFGVIDLLWVRSRGAAREDDGVGSSRRLFLRRNSKDLAITWPAPPRASPQPKDTRWHTAAPRAHNRRPSLLAPMIYGPLSSRPQCMGRALLAPTMHGPRSPRAHNVRAALCSRRAPSSTRRRSGARRRPLEPRPARPPPPRGTTAITRRRLRRSASPRRSSGSRRSVPPPPPPPPPPPAPRSGPALRTG